MKLRSLYIKILLSFLGVLFIAEILIMGLFIGTAGKSFRTHFDNQSIGKLQIFRNFVQQKIDLSPLVPIHQNQGVLELLQTFDDLFDLKLWITDNKNTLLMKTDDLPQNINLEKYSSNKTSHGDIKLYHLSRRHLNYYANVSINKGDEKFSLHIYMDNKNIDKPEAKFLIGLLTIGIIIAILIIPLAKVITNRIKHLNRSALKFANGTLSCRTSIKGHDEIAELGKSFNFMAEKLEKMIQGNKELTANISHELRSPLARIRISNQLIQDRLDKARMDHNQEDIGRTDLKQRDQIQIEQNLDIGDYKKTLSYTNNINDEVKVLDDLIDAILNLSKMDIQEAEFQPESIDLSYCVESIKTKFKPLFKQKELTFKNEISPLLKINSDKTRINTILSNLIDNAIKYTPEKGTIHISAEEKNDATVKVIIENSSPPLTTDDLNNIFEPFYRIDKTQISGSGLGLTIVKKLLMQCNGSIIARNSKQGLQIEILFTNQ